MATLEPNPPLVVDELHTATLLERQGVTDQEARDRYGCEDVFELAGEMFRRLPRRPDPPRDETSARPPQRFVLLTHGLLYSVPGVVYPAVLVEIGGPALLRGMLLATTLGWIWGMGTSVTAYRLLGQGYPQAAARIWRRLSLLGLGIAAADAMMLAATGAGDASLAVFVVLQMSFQLASGVLVFYGMEWRLAVIVLPTFVAGGAYLAHRYDVGHAVPVLITAVGTCVLAAGVAWWATGPTRQPRDRGAQPAPVRPALFSVLPCIAYAVLSALFLLYNTVPFVTAPLDLALAMAPLVVGMGTVEWRTHRFNIQAVELVRRARTTAEFHRSVWRLLLRELALCILTLASLGTLLLLALSVAGLLTPRGMLLVTTYLVLGGAYFVGFITVNHGHFSSILGITGAVLVLNIAATNSMAQYFAPYGEVPIFLASCVVLLALLLMALRLNIGDVHHYR
ncbi:hypothetical protein P2Q00_29835 [Streptomyces coacervatus]|uniref:hypothetical protein n=1 Tax=Streptomyces coacervatus TaxID=647381 RepID=UPI0023DC8997|nr:hypothetical protein [Streptomyces coacervatus]MDF2269602.1 hypothetical protein [Streptomyces coacervatus]